MVNWIIFNCLFLLPKITLGFDFKNPEVNVFREQNKFDLNFEYEVRDFVTMENVIKNLVNKK